MEKIWFIIIDGKKEGPYNVGNLKRHIRLTPDTLAWKEGMPQWLPIRQIPELKMIFEDDAAIPSDENVKKKSDVFKTEDETLTLRYEPPSFYFWLFIGALLIVYTLYQWLSVKS